MNRSPALLCALACFAIVSCHNDHDIRLHYEDTGHTYSMRARYNKKQTRKVEKYMDLMLGKKTQMSFVNSRIDGTIALDDNTIFYIKKYPGVLEIKLDKDENSRNSYEEIKYMCQGIKEVVVK